MRTYRILVIVLCLTLIVGMCYSAHALEISGKVIDVLGQPIEGARVELYEKNTMLESFVTDTSGYFNGTIKEDINIAWILISKEGYAPFSINRAEFYQEFILKREIDNVQEYLNSLILRDKEELQEGLTEVLISSEIDDINTSSEIFENIFTLNERFTIPLRTLVSKPEVASIAIRLLCYISEPDDLRYLLFLSEQTNTYYPSLAGALTSPSTQREWDYLQNCIILGVENTKNWRIALQAALALAVSRDKRVLEILENIPVDSTTILGQQIERSIRWIHERPEGLVGSKNLLKSIEEASEIFIDENERGHFAVRKITFDHHQKKALVSCGIYHDPLNAKGYTMVFHKSDELWLLKGIWWNWKA